MRRAGWLSAVVAAVVLLGYGVADAADVVPGVLTTASSPTTTPTPTSSDPPRPSLSPPLAGLSTQAPMPSPGGVARVLDPLLASPALGPGTAATVLDAATGQTLLDRGGAVAHIPASTTKLLTGAAVLSTLGGATTLATRVVQGATPDEIVLVGGGDALLGTGRSQLTEVEGRAGLATLAAQVAQALGERDVRDVAVRFDDGLFEGPALNPVWSAADVQVGFVGPVTALGLARDVPYLYHPGPADPSASAAAAFVRALRAQGVQVTGAVARTRATRDAAVLGEVRSAPVQDVLALTLSRSDNTLAEVLARLAAHAEGRPATATDAPIAVLEAVQRLGVDVGSTRIVDGSGLGDGSAVPSQVLADVLVLAAQAEQPTLRPLLTGLPVAGLTGTLAARYRAAGTHQAAGAVRAKTGSLTGVNSLAGTTVDADGRLLVFVVMSDEVPVGGSVLARRASDRVATALTGCGCR